MAASTKCYSRLNEIYHQFIVPYSFLKFFWYDWQWSNWTPWFEKLTQNEDLIVTHYNLKISSNLLSLGPGDGGGAGHQKQRSMMHDA